MTYAYPAAPLPPLPDYPDWQATCDTLHGHTQLLGKLAAALAPPEPAFGHLALRLTARGWETRPLVAPDGSGLIVVAIDLQVHEVVIEHSSGPTAHIPLTPHRSVGEVTRHTLAELAAILGAPVAIDPTPQEVPWTDPLDADETHAHYDTVEVAAYWAAAAYAAGVLAAVRAHHPGAATPVNAWWGSFDLALGMTLDASDDGSAPAREVAIGWWPGDAKYPHPAWYAYVSPAPDGIAQAPVAPTAARWDAGLGEFVLDWRALAAAPDAAEAIVDFGMSVRAAAGGTSAP